MAAQRSSADIAQLVSEHHAAVYGYAYRLTGSVHDAEDLAQQTFLVAQEKIGELRKMEAVKSWLFAILRNAFLKQRQRVRPRLATDVNLEVDNLKTTTPKEEIDSDLLQAALDRLPDASRLVVTMFYFEGSSYKEIARQLDLPIGTVMSRLARAKASLRSILFESCGDGVPPKPQLRPHARTGL
jgi:RNA polymerase sigma-70 factor, ECF subfamily